MVVKATGYGDNSYNYTRVVIDVKDVNDNRPVFSKPMYNVTIRGRIDTSVPVLTLHATDADQDGRQRVVYSFDPRNKKFLIDPNTGICGCLCVSVCSVGCLCVCQLWASVCICVFGFAFFPMHGNIGKIHNFEEWISKYFSDGDL